MTNKATLIIVVVTFCLGAIAGWLINSAWTEFDAKIGEGGTAVGSSADPIQELAELRRDYQELEQAFQELQDSAAADKEAIKPRRQPEITQGADPEPDAPSGDKSLVGEDIPLSFGAWNMEPALRSENWSEAGQAAVDVSQARLAGIGGRQGPEYGALERKGLRQLRDLRKRLENASPGLSTHPIVFVNLMAVHLEKAGKPLDERQVTAITLEGDAYGKAFQQLQGLIASGAIYLETEKKLRKIQLKLACMDRIVDEILTKAQWKVLFEPSTKGLLYYDVYQIGGLELERPNSSVYWYNDRAKAEEHLKIFIATEWGIQNGDLSQFAYLIEEWLDTIVGYPPGPKHPTSALHIDQVMPSVVTHVEFQKKILNELGPDSAYRDAIVSNPIYVIFPGLSQ